MKPYQEQNYYELLEVTPAASAAEIRAAYERAVETYSADSVAIYALENPGQADELREKLREAMEILTDQGLRVDYDRMIGVPARAPAEDAGNAPALAAAELMASSEALHSTHPEVKVSYFPTPSPPPPSHAPAPEPAPPPAAEPPTRPRMTAREIEGAPSIGEQEAIATAEAAMANVAARAREAPARPKALEIPPDAEFSGELLRRVRESRGLTVQQIADRTRISARHLENIEADRYAALPAAVYLRGILMNLARELGLDQGRVSKSYLSLASGKKP